MKLFQKWRIKKHRQEIEECVKVYNEALQSLADGASKLLNVAEKSGTATEALRKSVCEMISIAEKAAITPEDLQRGERHYGKEQGRY